MTKAYRNTPKLFMQKAEFCETTGLSEYQVDKMLADNSLRHIRLGRPYLISIVEVDLRVKVPSELALQNDISSEYLSKGIVINDDPEMQFLLRYVAHHKNDMPKYIDRDEHDQRIRFTIAGLTDMKGVEACYWLYQCMLFENTSPDETYGDQYARLPDPFDQNTSEIFYSIEPAAFEGASIHSIRLYLDAVRKIHPRYLMLETPEQRVANLSDSLSPAQVASALGLSKGSIRTLVKPSKTGEAKIRAEITTKIVRDNDGKETSQEDIRIPKSELVRLLKEADEGFDSALE